MSDLARRVIRLERRRPERRCATCWDWPPTRVVYVNDPYEGRAEDDPGPERCPACDWEPLTVQVEYVDGWSRSA